MREKQASERLHWAVERCRELGLRRTKAMEEVLKSLIASERPLTLADLAEAENLRDQCDRATIYRLLIRLEEKGVLRRLGLHDRAGYFTMKYPGEHSDYLICSECGSIEELDIACPVEALEKEISRESGYRELYHELEFFGVCPKCA